MVRLKVLLWAAVLVLGSSACSSKKSVDKFSFAQENTPVVSPSPAPTDTPTPEPSPSPSPSPTPITGCLDDALGEFKDFNVITQKNAVIRSSVLQNRMGSAAKIRAARSTVGEALSPNHERADIAAKTRLVLRRTKVPSGAAFYGTKKVERKSTVLGGVKKGTPVDIDRGFKLVEFLSSHSANMQSNGTTKRDCPTGVIPIKKCVVTLTGTHPEINVFDVESKLFRGAKKVHISIPPNSSALVNVKGASFVLWSGKRFTLDAGVAPEHIMWNWKSKGLLILRNTEWTGALLAPKATVHTHHSRIWGSVMSKSLISSGSRFESTQYNGCVPRF